MAQHTTPQEQIAEIYEILKKQEGRRKWSLFFIWTKRIIIWGIIILIVLYPGFIFSQVNKFLMPMIEESIEKVYEKNKAALQETAQNTANSVMEKAKSYLR